MKIINLKDKEQEINILERLHMEVTARENIINFMIQNNMKSTS
jgi:hypothetical protein